MTYFFDQFKNIRTFPARSRVFHDGNPVPELSDESDPALPLHIIHLGELSGVQNWFIDMNDAENVFFTAKITTSGETKIRMEINTNLPNLEFDGKLIIKNAGILDLDISGNNNRDGTKIKIETKLFAAADSENSLIGTANVPAGVEDIETDIGFSALLGKNVKKLVMSPRQKISGVPKSAGHSASIFNPTSKQIQYLSTAGLSDAEAVELMNKVFMEET
jgi:hypothetical protein